MALGNGGQAQARDEVNDRGVFGVRKVRPVPAGEKAPASGFGALFGKHRAFDFFAHRPHLQLMVGVLEHKPCVRHQGILVDFPVTNEEAPRRRRIKPRENAGKRRFPRAVVAYERRDARGDGKGRVAENGFRGRIGKRDVIRGENGVRRDVVHRHVRERETGIRDMSRPQAVGAAQQRVFEHRKRPFGFDGAVLHDDDGVGDVFEPIKPVVDDENGAAVFF